MPTATKTDGLVFESWYKSATYTVRPATRDMVNGMPINHRGLHAEFQNHVWSSKKAEKELGWTPEERVMVEQYLIAHPDFGKSRGIYLEGHTIEALGRPQEVEIPQLKLRCAAFTRDADGMSVQCNNEPEQGGDFCKTHLDEINAALNPPQVIEDHTGPAVEDIPDDYPDLSGELVEDADDIVT